jgi:hypothetical protein
MPGLVRDRVGSAQRRRAESQEALKLQRPQVRVHRVRAESFRKHASSTKSPGSREMYLRLAEREIALAEHLEQRALGEAELVAATEEVNETLSPLPQD